MDSSPGVSASQMEEMVQEAEEQKKHSNLMSHLSYLGMDQYPQPADDMPPSIQLEPEVFQSSAQALYPSEARRNLNLDDEMDDSAPALPFYPDIDRSKETLRNYRQPEDDNEEDYE